MTETNENTPKIPENTPSEEPVIDEDVKEELEEEYPEDPFLTEYAMGGNSGNESEKVDVTSEWIGDGDEWQGKTQLSAEQIIAMTQTRMMPSIFDELEGVEEEILDMVENMEKYAVSHKGMAREQHVSVLRALHSGEHHDDRDERSALLNMLSAQPENDEE